ncbi:MAG: hypothetical protein PHT69_05535 [Bacteroidales bacterium]|nr:hypothetical protein [Bacteroidales bacterium]
MIDKKLVKAIFKGAFTFIPGVLMVKKLLKPKIRHSSGSAEFCYSFWLSLLVLFNDKKIDFSYAQIGEIGTGGSFGIGICALLTGAEKFYALEIEDNFDINKNILIFNRILGLFEEKSDIKKFNTLNFNISDYSFPDKILSKNNLSKSLVEKIRYSILNPTADDSLIKIVKNWHHCESLNLNFIFSRAVLEHVKCPEKIYRSIYKHLSTDAFSFHDIEFHSHNVTTHPTYHYKINKYLWFFIFGQRSYFLNRWDNSKHLAEIEKNKFHIIVNEFNRIVLNGDISKYNLRGSIFIFKK